MLPRKEGLTVVIWLSTVCLSLLLWLPVCCHASSLGARGTSGQFSLPSEGHLLDGAFRLANGLISRSTSSQNESAILLAIYASLQGDKWLPYGQPWTGLSPWNTSLVKWGSNPDKCTWTGVLCCQPVTIPGTSYSSPTGVMIVLEDVDAGLSPLAEPVAEAHSCYPVGAVTGIMMPNFSLVGSLPSSLADLQFLAILSLPLNPNLVGPLPVAFLSLPTILFVDLRDTNMLCAALSISGSTWTLPSTPACTPAKTGSCNTYTEDFAVDGVPLTCSSAYTLLNSTVSGPYVSDLLLAKQILILYPAQYYGYSTCQCAAADMELRVNLDVNNTLTPFCFVPPNDVSFVIVMAVVVPVAFGILFTIFLTLLLKGRFLHRKSINRQEGGDKTIAEAKKMCAPGTNPDMFGTSVTLAATDVEGSTELWEWAPDVMDHALMLHDKLMRVALSCCYGYEVTTEGDAFLLAFHEPIDAARWCLLVQMALLKLNWPPELLTHPKCAPQPLIPLPKKMQSASSGLLNQDNPRDSVASNSPQLLLLFKGLSVRMGISTGVPSVIRKHPVTGRMQYMGTLLRLATCIGDMGSGGQVLLEPFTWQAIHAKLEDLDLGDDEVEQIADTVNKDVGVSFRKSVVVPNHNVHANIPNTILEMAVPSMPRGPAGRSLGQQVPRQPQGVHPVTTRGTRRASTNSISQYNTDEASNLPSPVASTFSGSLRTSNATRSQASQRRNSHSLTMPSEPAPQTQATVSSARLGTSEERISSTPHCTTSSDRHSTNVPYLSGSERSSAYGVNAHPRVGSIGTASTEGMLRSMTASAAGQIGSGALTGLEGLFMKASTMETETDGSRGNVSNNLNIRNVSGFMSHTPSMHLGSVDLLGSDNEHGLLYQIKETEGNEYMPGQGTAMVLLRNLVPRVPSSAQRRSTMTRTELSFSVNLTENASELPEGPAVSAFAMQAGKAPSISPAATSSDQIHTDMQMYDAAVSDSMVRSTASSQTASHSNLPLLTKGMSLSSQDNFVITESHGTVSKNNKTNPGDTRLALPPLPPVVLQYPPSRASSLVSSRQHMGGPGKLEVVNEGSMEEQDIRRGVAEANEAPTADGTLERARSAVNGKELAPQRRTASGEATERNGPSRLSAPERATFSAVSIDRTEDVLMSTMTPSAAMMSAAYGLPPHHPFRDKLFTAGPANRSVSPFMSASKQAPLEKMHYPRAGNLSLSLRSYSDNISGGSNNLQAISSIEDNGSRSSGKGSSMTREVSAYMMPKEDSFSTAPLLPRATSSSVRVFIPTFTQSMRKERRFSRLRMPSRVNDDYASNYAAPSEVQVEETLGHLERAVSWSDVKDDLETEDKKVAASASQVPDSQWMQGAEESSYLQPSRSLVRAKSLLSEQMQQRRGPKRFGSLVQLPLPQEVVQLKPREPGTNIKNRRRSAIGLSGIMRLAEDEWVNQAWDTASDGRCSVATGGFRSGMSTFLQLADGEDNPQVARTSETSSVTNAVRSSATPPSHHTPSTPPHVPPRSNSPSVTVTMEATQVGSSRLNSIEDMERTEVGHAGLRLSSITVPMARWLLRRKQKPAGFVPFEGSSTSKSEHMKGSQAHGGVEMVSGRTQSETSSSPRRWPQMRVTDAVPPREKSIGGTSTMANRIPSASQDPLRLQMVQGRLTKTSTEISPAPIATLEHPILLTLGGVGVLRSIESNGTAVGAAEITFGTGREDDSVRPFPSRTRGRALPPGALGHALNRTPSGNLQIGSPYFATGVNSGAQVLTMRSRELDGVIDEVSSPTQSGARRLHRVVVIDMGVHRLKAIGSTANSETYQGVQVMQLMPEGLKARAAYLPALTTESQIAPSFFDAPGVRPASFLPPNPNNQLQLPPVSLIFITPEGYKDVTAAKLDLAERSLAIFCSVVRDVTKAFRVYECQEYEGSFMCAAHTLKGATEMALALQFWLLAADWPEELLHLAPGKVQMGPLGFPVFRGLRAKVGIYEGVPLSVVPHTTTGRADYFGAVVNRAARFMSGAAGGQVLMDWAAANQVMMQWHDDVANGQVVLPRRPNALAPSLSQSRAMNIPGSTPANSSFRAMLKPNVSAKSVASSPVGFSWFLGRHSGWGRTTLERTSESKDGVFGRDPEGSQRPPRTTAPGEIWGTDDAEPRGTSFSPSQWLSRLGTEPQSYSEGTWGQGSYDPTGLRSAAALPEEATVHSASGNTPFGVPSTATRASIEEVELVDMGEFEFKGLSASQHVASLQLVSLAGRAFPPLLPTRKARQVRPGQGVVDRAVLVLPTPCGPPSQMAPLPPMPSIPADEDIVTL